MELAARIGTMAQRGAPLQYDAEVEYLQGDKKAVIDTGIPGNRVYGFEISAYFDGTTNQIYTGVDAEKPFSFQIYSFDLKLFIMFWANSRYNLGNEYLEKGRLFNFKANEGDIFLNGEKIASYNHSVACGISSESHVFLFGASAIQGVFQGRISDYKISDFKLYGLDGYVMFDAKSVRFTNESGVSEGAMYDRVSGQLFRNAGTGAFIIGPDVVSSEGGGTKCLTPRRSYRRSLRPSARFCAHSQEWEVAA